MQNKFQIVKIVYSRLFGLFEIKNPNLDVSFFYALLIHHFFFFYSLHSEFWS